jgi:tetratricopeptide (TPR) repeat protein
MEDNGPYVDVRDLGGPMNLCLGALSLFDESINLHQRAEVELDKPDPSPGSEGPERIYSRLIHALTSALWRVPIENATWHEVIAQARTACIDPEIKRTAFSPLIFSPKGRHDVTIEVPVLRHLVRAELAPLEDLIPRLKRLLEKQDRPEYLVNLGIAQAAIGDLESARESLLRARDHDEISTGLKAEAQDHLGRVLFQRGEVEAAIDELKKATELDPKRAGAQYYLGRALRDYARFNLKELSDNAFRAYLAAGAPLGYRDEVRGWLTPETPPAATR